MNYPEDSRHDSTWPNLDVNQTIEIVRIVTQFAYCEGHIVIEPTRDWGKFTVRTRNITLDCATFVSNQLGQTT